MTDAVNLDAVLLVNRLLLASERNDADVMAAFGLLFGKRCSKSFGAALNDRRIEDAQVKNTH